MKRIAKVVKPLNRTNGEHMPSFEFSGNPRPTIVEWSEMIDIFQSYYPHHFVIGFDPDFIIGEYAYTTQDRYIEGDTLVDVIGLVSSGHTFSTTVNFIVWTIHLLDALPSFVSIAPNPDFDRYDEVIT